MRNAFYRLLALALVVLPVSAGCEGQGVALCSQRCDCERCSEAEFDQCLAEFDSDEYAAMRHECSLEQDEWVACQEATGFCDGDDFESSCKHEKERWKYCIDH